MGFFGGGASAEQAGAYSSKNAQNALASGFYNGTGSTAILPVAASRFDTTNTFNFGARAIFFYRYNINKGLSFSGISIAYTANTAVSRTLSSITEAGGTATATSTAHGFAVGDRVLISGASPSAYNGTKTILSVPSANTFTFSVPSGTGSASGTITAREFVGAALYDSNPETMLPKNKLADVASIPSTSNVITGFDANVTVEAGTYYVGICGSRITNNFSLATFVATNEAAIGINTNLFGMRTGHFSQFRGGIGLLGYDNSGASNGNSGMPLLINQIGTANPGSGGVQVQTDASAGNNASSKIFMIGLVVA
jgi:hypothetical protein